MIRRWTKRETQKIYNFLSLLLLFISARRKKTKNPSSDDSRVRDVDARSTLSDLKPSIVCDVLFRNIILEGENVRDFFPLPLSTVVGARISDFLISANARGLRRLRADKTEKSFPEKNYLLLCWAM